MAALVCDNVVFAYKKGRGELHGIALECAEGSYTLIAGTSGAGKSTLFRLLVRLEEPDSGVIYFQGRPLADYPPMLLRRKIMMLPQAPTLFPGTIRETLCLPWGFAVNKDRKAPDDRKLSAWMERLRLSEIPLEENAVNLSVGQQQRLCLIRCLLLDPAVILLDEPTSALDAESRQIVLDITREMHQTRGMTVLQIDHSGYEPPFPFVQYTIANGTMERTRG